MPYTPDTVILEIVNQEVSLQVAAPKEVLILEIAAAQGPPGGGNATHTGHMAGATVLTVQPEMISDQTAQSPDSDWEVLTHDPDTGILYKSTVAEMQGAGSVDNIARFLGLFG